MRKLVGILALWMWTSACIGATVTIDKNRTVLLVGMVMNNALEGAKKIGELVAKSKDPIYVVINSPGGSVSHGAYLLDAMAQARAQDVQIRCVVAGKAISMAFMALTECSDIVATKSSEFLFHPVRVMVRDPITARLARDLSWQLQKIDHIFIQRVAALTGLEGKALTRPFYLETMWMSGALLDASPRKFFRIVEGIVNLPPEVLTWPSVNPFGEGQLIPRNDPEQIRKALETLTLMK